MKKTIFLLVMHFTSHLYGQKISGQLDIDRKPNVNWWAGIIREGHKMPLKNGYEANLYGNCWRNQLQPLLLSTDGELIWSEESFGFEFNENKIIVDNYTSFLFHEKVGNSLKDAFLYASKNYFPPNGIMPPQEFFSIPQYNTWIELTYDQNQEDILNYAHGIVENGMPPGIIMIDDNWQEDYGKWDFHRGRFPNPKAMMKELKEMGFKVMLWVCPFVSPDSDIYRDLSERKLFMLDNTDEPAMVRWWNGVSAVLDLTNPESEKWFKGTLDKLIEVYEVDGFKLDAGDSRFYVGLKSLKDVSPNTHTELFAKIGLEYPYNEYRATWKMGGKNLIQRLHDKNHDWTDLKKLIPHMLLEGIMGYPFSCPDMIGGGQFKSFLNDAVIDEELIVRSTQVHALMPMMQFSVAPWRILDKKHFQAVLEAILLREKFKKTILSLAKEASVNGEPIIRSMEYVFPNQGYALISDQFMLGNNILVAPFLEKGEGTRKIILPIGNWMSDGGKIFSGNKMIETKVPLNRIPHFVLLD